MNGTRLVFRSLIHYWRTGLVVAFGVAVATAVIVGSLLAGDSVTASVRDVALARLGHVDVALTAPRFCNADLADRVARHPSGRDRVRRVMPVVLARGSLTAPDRGITIPRVNVIGVDDGFRDLFPDSPMPRIEGTTAPMNTALYRDLGVRSGARLELKVERPGGAPHGTLFGHRDPTKTLAPVRVTAGPVVRTEQGGDFSLNPGTETPRNLFVDRAWLARRLDSEGQVNALLITTAANEDPLPALGDALSDAAALPARGLRLEAHQERGYLSLESRTLLLSERRVNAAFAAARATGGRAARTSVYLAETVATRSGGGSISYAVVAGLEPLDPSPISSVEPGEVVLNRWAATDLGAEPGDEVVV
ncbi:MAG: ABC transporter permease, partial [Planctomycetota bacterium]